MLPSEDLRAGGAFERTRRPVDAQVRAEARAILSRVRAGGDAALLALTRELDGADLTHLRLPSEQLEQDAGAIPSGLAGAIERAAERLRALAAAQLPSPWQAESEGVRYGEVVTPLARVGCYVPGGRAAYPSTVLMTAVPAAVAGVEEIVVCTPPDPSGAVDPAVLFACATTGVREVYRLGGAQAIAAMAYGTETIRPVERIVGPGNAWVTAAKAEVAGVVGIDGLTGPTELVVVADGSADPTVLAADLIAQAEHAPDAEAYVVTWDEPLVPAVRAALRVETETAHRREILDRALTLARALLVRDAAQAATVADRIAPEHLQVVVAGPRGFLERCRRYGAAFLGPSTPWSGSAPTRGSSTRRRVWRTPTRSWCRASARSARAWRTWRRAAWTGPSSRSGRADGRCSASASGCSCCTSGARKAAWTASACFRARFAGSMAR